MRFVVSASTYMIYVHIYSSIQTYNKYSTTHTLKPPTTNNPQPTTHQKRKKHSSHDRPWPLAQIGTKKKGECNSATFCKCACMPPQGNDIFLHAHNLDFFNGTQTSECAWWQMVSFWCEYLSIFLSSLVSNYCILTPAIRSSFSPMHSKSLSSFGMHLDNGGGGAGQLAFAWW